MYFVCVNVYVLGFGFWILDGVMIVVCVCVVMMCVRFGCVCGDDDGM